MLTALGSATGDPSTAGTCINPTSPNLARRRFPDDFGQGISIANYDVTPDGHFIMLRRGANGGKLRVVVNWTEELKQILAAGGVR